MIADFEPIALIAATPWLIAAKKDLPANDLKGLIAWLKANPDKASLGTAGVGSPSHIGAVLLAEHHRHALSARALSRHRAGDPDLVAGQIDMSILDPVRRCRSFAPARIKVFAVMAKSRTANAPEVPTVDEAGVPGLHWRRGRRSGRRRARRRTIIAKLNGAVVKALADPAVRKARRAELRGRAARGADAGILGAFHKAEIEKWWPIIKAAGIKGG